MTAHRLPYLAALAAVGFVPFAAAAQDPPAKVADPMASFARMVGGEWRMTAQSGTSMFDTWHWGPGKHSLRVMTDGSGADGKPWRELQVVYWHPGRKQVRLLGLSPFARGVSEGTITFEGETADAVFDLYQTGVRRKMRLALGLRRSRQVPRDAVGGDRPRRYSRPWSSGTSSASKPPAHRAAHRRRGAEAPGAPEGPRTAPGPHLGGRRATGPPEMPSTSGRPSSGSRSPTGSTLAWSAPSKDGEPRHLLDAYFYHHTGADALRCLALSNGGGVYEGDLTVLDGGALQLDLKGYEGDRVVQHVVRFDFEKDGTLRHRVWSLKGTERTLMLDVHHKKVTVPPHPAR